MPTYNPSKIPPAPQPTRIFFDPFQSSSTGHQVDKAILSGSTSWRDSRAYKLSHQFRDSSGGGGDEFRLDLVGAGSEGFGKDGRKPNGGWEKDKEGEGLRKKEGNGDIRFFMAGRTKGSDEKVNSGGKGTFGSDSEGRGVKRKRDDGVFSLARPMVKRDNSTTSSSISHPTKTPLRTIPCSTDSKSVSTFDPDLDGTSAPPSTILQPNSCLLNASDTTNDNNNTPLSPSNTPKPQIFTNLVIYLNGSTYPYISDHKLKQLIAQHGGMTSIHLARRKVTHVIVSDSSSSSISPFITASTPGLDSTPRPSTRTTGNSGARTVKGPSGALASSKIQKENLNVHGKGVKYVTVKWVLDSIERGKRVSEVNYVPKGLKGRFGGSVFDTK